MRDRKTLLLALAAIGPASIVILGPTLSLLERNASLFDYSVRAAVPIIFGAICLWFATFVLLNARTSFLQGCGVSLLALGPMWLFYRAGAEFFPAATIWLFIACLIAAMVVGVAFSHRKESVAGLAAIFALAVSIPAASSAIHLVSGPATIVAQSQSASSTNLPNIYQVIFDEYQSDFLKRDLDSIKDELGGFTFFSEALTAYGHTEMALGSIFSGRKLLPEQETPAEFVWNAFFDPRQSLVQLLGSAGYKTEGYPFFIYPGGKISPFMETHLQKAMPQDAAGNQQKTLFYMFLYSQLPPPINASFVPSKVAEGLAAFALLPDQVPVASRDNFRQFIRQEAERPPNGRYVLLHLIIPHSPHVLNADCSVQSPPLNSPENIFAQNKCPITLMGELVHELKRLNRYDESMIIFHGDHGAGFYFNGDSLVWGGDILGEGIAATRSRTALLYKPFGASSNQPLTTSTLPVTLLDVAPTILEAAHISPPPAVQGIALDSKRTRPMERTFDNYTTDREYVVDGEMLRFKIEPWQATLVDSFPLKKETISDVLKQKTLH
jgi:hypothetical protein